MQTTFRKTFLLLVLALIATTATAQSNRKYVDVSTLNVINKAQNDGLPLKRIDGSKYEVAANVRKVLEQTTGLVVAFRTNSRAIHLQWKTVNKRLGANMTPVFHSGMDLYIRDNGEWIFAGIARPNTLGTEHKATVVKRMEEGMKECLLYLPMFNSVDKLEIGVDGDAQIEPLPSPFKHKIVFVGSSLTHGASAARPGASYVARLGRALNAETPNIGMSGRCKLDDYFADIVCDSKADAFIFDTFSNPTGKQIDERLSHFVERIATAHPRTPMIFLQTTKRDIGYFDLGARKRNEQQREAAARGMATLCQKYKNVYFLDPGIYTGDDYEGTVDGTHLNDLGVQRTIDMLLPKIKKILKKNGIR